MTAIQKDGGEATCPICQLKLPLSEIEAHVQVHFGMSQNSDDPVLIEEDTPTVACLQCGEDVALDQYASHEAAHRYSKTGSYIYSLQAEEATAAQLQRQHNEAEESRHFEALQSKFGMGEKSPGRGGKADDEKRWARKWPQGPYAEEARARKLDAPTHMAICKAQQKGEYYEMQTAIVPLLKQALCAQNGKFQAILSGPVMHFQGSPGEVGWSCGYKNMQMQISHLLQQDKVIADAIFGGCGYVPDVTSLQAWLECAWAAGYDPMGAEQLGGKVQGTVKWVGTTEAAALLRQFGVRAHVVDFKGSPKGKAQKTDADSSVRSSAKKPAPQVHFNVECDSCGIRPIRGARYRSLTRQNHDLCEGCRYVDEADTNGPYEEIAPIVKGPMDHSAMIDWVWRYFTDTASPNADASESKPPSLASKLTGPVQLSNKPPLYLQHEGHSRTIIGVEKQFPPGDAPPKVVFLILDPSTRTGPLDRALRERKGWQRMLKRGVETLRMEDYQILYCEPGLASGSELERLKIMSSSEYFGPLEWTEERRAELNKAAV